MGLSEFEVTAPDVPSPDGLKQAHSFACVAKIHDAKGNESGRPSTLASLSRDIGYSQSHLPVQEAAGLSRSAFRICSI